MGGQDSFDFNNNRGKRNTRSASDAPNCNHRRFDFLNVVVARVWRVLVLSKLLWLEFGAFWFSQSCCGSSLARPRRSSLDVFHVFVVMFIYFSLISNVPSWHRSWEVFGDAKTSATRPEKEQRGVMCRLCWTNTR